MLHHDPAAKTHDRIGFTISIALAMHVAIILGVGFAMQIPTAPNATRMDITLSSYMTDQEILDADFVAQTNQEASGSESDKVEITTDEVAPINNPNIQDVETELEIPKQQTASQSMILITTISESDLAAMEQEEERQERIDDLQGEMERLQQQLEIASLQAKLAKEQQAYARLPRIRRASSVATKAAVDAEYLYRWQQRIEKIGNDNFPHQAITNKLYGDVRVLVVINADGTLLQAEILESSGIPLLDDAALKIVRLASPYPAFPPELKKEADVLEIIRTWEFRKDRFSHQ